MQAVFFTAQAPVHPMHTSDHPPPLLKTAGTAVHAPGIAASASTPKAVDGFAEKFAEWEKENRRSLLAYALTQTQRRLPVGQRKAEAEDIHADARSYFWRKRIIPGPLQAREKIRWVARDRYGKAAHQPGNEQVPASWLANSQAVDGGVEGVEDDHAYHGAACAGWEWLQQAFASPDAEAQTNELLRVVHQAVASLHEDFRTVIVLHYFEDHAISDIAALLGLTRQAVNYRRREAEAALKALLKNLI
ncbi:MAG TPA: hypothetical protein DIT64_16235 [Verrucomicrobiales bacterium]|nr:hypothetical protein [Verrucomicrobiales bacterium]